MPPSKRKQRRSRAADLSLETSDVEMPDSSPTRPSAKKRKTNPRNAKKQQPPSPEPPLQQDTEVEEDAEEEEEDEEEEVSSHDLMDKVISYLQASKDLVNVARQHANDLTSSSQKPVSAFAKISGRDWTYYVREQTINIGRPPDDRQLAPQSLPEVSSPIQDLKDQFPVHIDLGPSKIVSRHHASIFYDPDWPAEGGWHVRVNGRNGVRVNNMLLRRSARQQIKSGAILEIAGTQMMFVTPGDRVEIDPSFVERAEAAENGQDISGLGLGPNATQSDNDDTKVGKSDGNELPGYQSLAPAPPNFKRASTPPQGLDIRSGRGVFDSKSGQQTSTSPMYGRGMMMESTQEIDYSRDAAKDLKPPYSYAHMIAQAIFSSEDQKLTLSNIYSFIADNYAFYRHSNSGWQNSIRHNLSLNKAFQKVPRRTDEPGKGMKWQIAPEHREEYWKKQQRRVGTSSNPSSPASNKDINPNFRGANGQNLGYDTTMVYQFPAKDAGNAPQAPKLSMSFPPFPPSQQPFPGPNQPPLASQPVSTSTPQRRRTNTADTDPAVDDSPLPAYFPSSAPRPAQSNPFYGLATAQPHAAPSHLHSPTRQNITLSDSFLDTPFPSLSQHTLSTPAPLRQNPKLAPPSTLVAPSKFMPESSPAGPGLFWKGFLGGVTPGPNSAIPPDMSPVKDEPDRHNGLDDRDVMSSSPPPIDDGPLGGSPSKPARGRGKSLTASQSSGKRDGEMISMGRSSKLNGATSPLKRDPEDTLVRDGPSLPPQPLNNNGSTNLRHSLGPSPPLGLTSGPGTATQPPTLFQPQAQSQPSNLMARARTNSRNEVKNEKATDEDDEGGFDLARGFAPIGSSLQRSGGVKS